MKVYYGSNIKFIDTSEVTQSLGQVCSRPGLPEDSMTKSQRTKSQKTKSQKTISQKTKSQMDKSQEDKSQIS